MIAPDSEAGIVEAVSSAAGPLLIQGNGSKAGMLRPVQASATVSTRNLRGVTFYSPNELVISAKAGTLLTEIETLLAQSGQHLIAEPTHFFGENQTIGGLIATNLSGPRRIMGGAMRDHVLGLRAVNGKGEILKFGGRVLKNVTGLDLCKLLAGSHGTLAVITEVTLKVLPIPEATGTILLQGLDATSGVAALAKGLGSPFSVSGAAYLPEQKIAALRIEEFEASVKYRCEKLGGALKAFGNVEILDKAASEDFWRGVRDCRMLKPGDAIWRVSVRPSAGPGILAAAMRLGVSGFLDWGGGLLWLSGPAEAEIHAAICAAAAAAGGVWWLLQAPTGMRAAVEVVPPEAPALAKIRSRIQQSFDPRGILNPGRLRAA
jgi:glycolate oxidase FAD binding subunit